jgi:glycosyltransferase involved in cell wall biosynthesis
MRIIDKARKGQGELHDARGLNQVVFLEALSLENAGVCGERNAAYKYARGKYIWWLDADALLAPDKIEMQMIAIESLHVESTLEKGKRRLCLQC